MIDETSMGLGIVARIGIGVAFDVGMDNIGAGIATGAGIGVALGAAWSEASEAEWPVRGCSAQHRTRSGRTTRNS
jgi:hypothetical protein